jgi:hypothetical protein
MLATRSHRHAEEADQTAARVGRQDLASIIARKERKITVAGLVAAGLSRLWYCPVTQIQPPGRSHT